MGEVAAGGERHAEDSVAGLQEGEEHGAVGLGARVRLHVGEAAAEDLARAVDGQALGAVDLGAAAVVAAAGVAFGVLVGQDRALGVEHGGGDHVLARDQLDAVLLPGELGADGVGELGVGLGEGRVEETVLALAWGGLFVHGTVSCRVLCCQRLSIARPPPLWCG